VVKFLKVSRVAIITRGRYAGKKAIIIQPVDSLIRPYLFSYALVIDIKRYLPKVTRHIGKKRVEKRSKVKLFVVLINYNHIMPTRYTLELEGLKRIISNDTFKEVSQ
jgi:large subunit ribosomal protein L27e